MFQQIVAFFMVFYLFVAGYFAHPSPYYFTDWQAYRNLQSGSVADIYNTKLWLTENAKMVMAGADPAIESKADFNSLCNPGVTVVELGCYISTIPDHIYIMQVNDPAVKSVMDVTAAHEFLHAEYSRLSGKEKQKVNTLIEQQLAKITDPKLNKRLASYAKTEPGQQDNELHSIFGTEYPNLIPALENYYKQYFRNRALIVGWSQANTDYVTTKENEIAAGRARIEADNANLKALEARMNVYLSSGQINLYNSLVPTQNGQVRAINAEIADYNAKVNAYNDLIAAISNQSYSSFDLVK